MTLRELKVREERNPAEEIRKRHRSGGHVNIHGRKEQGGKYSTRFRIIEKMGKITFR